MPTEHYRMYDGKRGLCQGGYCLNCGEGGLNMYGSGHVNLNKNGPAYFCEPNPELVKELRELNK